jgi:ribulose 1,5-bisphosphate carboxylase large subunit-like protein
MRQAVDAALNGISLKEYALDHAELARALETWP